MSINSSIDLSKVRAPGVVEKLDYNKILDDIKNELRILDVDLDLDHPSDPMIKILEVIAYRELHLRQRINEAAKAVMLATARGTDLDNLAALFGIARPIIDAGDPEADPPVPPIYDNDDEHFRRLIQLALEGFTTAGSRGAYTFHALKANYHDEETGRIERVKDVLVGIAKDEETEESLPGVVKVTILSDNTHGINKNGKPTNKLIEAVNTALSDEEVRPLTDFVSVVSPTILEYSVRARLAISSGPGAEEVRQASAQALQDYVTEHHLLGNDIALSGIYAALHRDGVDQVQDLKVWFKDKDGRLLEIVGEGEVIAPDRVAYCKFIKVTRDNAAPIDGARDLTWIDTDMRRGILTGDLILTRAQDESDIEKYKIYWAIKKDDHIIKFSNPLLNIDVKTNEASIDTEISIHLEQKKIIPLYIVKLVLGKPDTDLLEDNVIYMSFDANFPETTWHYFCKTRDNELLKGMITADNILVSLPKSEEEIEEYVFDSKIEDAIIEAVKEDALNKKYSLQGATHLLVLTSNDSGEMKTGVTIEFEDKYLPEKLADAIDFSDMDLGANEVKGTVQIGTPDDESTIESYVLYWGANETEKLTEKHITELFATGANLEYSLPENTPIPEGATHLLVFTKNQYGEMETGISIGLVDAIAPVHMAEGLAFTDVAINAAKMSITITRALDESDITAYEIYWADAHKQPLQLITSLNNPENDLHNLTYILDAEFTVPEGGEYVLVLTSNLDGEMGSGVSLAIDYKLPTAMATTLQPNQTNPLIITDLETGNLERISGEILIGQAESGNRVRYYHLYWGINSNEKLIYTENREALITQFDDSMALQYQFNDEEIPMGATHLLLFTANTYGEMSDGISLELVPNVNLELPTDV